MTTILHLSDLHISSVSLSDSKIVIDALLRDLVSLKRTESVVPDIVIFSGDLVNAGESDDQFELANSHLVSPLLSALQLPRENLFIVPGNHDLDRSVYRKYQVVHDGLVNQLTSVASTNKFIDTLQSADANFLETIFSLQRNFDEKIAKQFTIDAITSSPLLRTFVRRIGKCRVGIACLNSAWRATGESDNRDKGRLIIGERNIDLALKDLAETDIRVAIFHHPPSWLAEFDSVAVESRLYSAFDLLFCGHIHRTAPEARTTVIGTSILSQGGCLYETRDFFNGYSVLRVDIQKKSVEIYMRSYFDSRREFAEAINVVDNGRITLQLQPKQRTGDDQEVEDVLRENRGVIREQAREHLAMMGSDITSGDFRDTFVCPQVSSRPEYESETRDEVQADLGRVVDVSEIVTGEENYLIYGKRQYGRTTLGHFLSVRLSEGAGTRSRIPAIVDFERLKPGRDMLARAIRNYLPEVALSKIRDLLTRGLFVLIVDNCDFSDRQNIERLSAFVTECPGVRWICLVAQMAMLGRSTQKELMNETKIQDFTAVHLHAFSRHQIRELSHKWARIDASDGDDKYKLVMGQIRKFNLPRTGYIVSLLLWALHQKKQGERINEAVLLQNVIENLLGKADYTKGLRKDFDYRSKEIILQHIAVYLRDRNGYLPVNDVFEYVCKLFRDFGLSFNASTVLQMFVETGVLGIDANEHISFKYKCFQEYFVCGRLMEDKTYQSGILADRKYLDFDREIELLSGLERQNLDLLVRFESDLQRLVPGPVEKQDLGQLQKIRINAKAFGEVKEKISKTELRKRSAQQVDDLLDAAEKEMARLNAGNNSPEARNDHGEATKQFLDFMKCLDLYGRVIRNSEFVGIAEKKAHAGRYIRWWLSITLMIVEVLDAVLGEADRIQTKHGRGLSKEDIVKADYVSKLIITGGMMSIASTTLATEKLMAAFEEMFKASDTPQAAKFLLAIVLFDLRCPTWATYWRQLVANVKGSNLILSLLAYKLMAANSMQVLSEIEHKTVESMFGEIQIALGLPKAQKARAIEKIRKRALAVRAAKKE